MFSQLEEKVRYVGGKGFGTIPIENSDSGAGVNDRIPKMNFRGGEVKNGRDTKGNEAKGLKMRE